MRRLFLFFAISILITACAAMTNRPKNVSTETQPACQTSKLHESKKSFPEIQGKMISEGEMWVLLFF
jgi:outer membrane biogenesis lipoprotein LolB